ncbi:unnamed protein product [Amoebophrya sp. A120]|nr:unnamed protein product [Amoebophrya sp. A120]|eukprot:GSA120T00002776001.1
MSNRARAARRSKGAGKKGGDGSQSYTLIQLNTRQLRFTQDNISRDFQDNWGPVENLIARLMDCPHDPGHILGENILVVAQHPSRPREPGREPTYYAISNRRGYAYLIARPNKTVRAFELVDRHAIQYHFKHKFSSLSDGLFLTLTSRGHKKKLQTRFGDSIYERHIPLHPDDLADVREEVQDMVKTYHLADLSLREYLPGKNPNLFRVREYNSTHAAAAAGKEASTGCRVGDVIAHVVARTEQEATACGGLLYDTYTRPRVELELKQNIEQVESTRGGGRGTYEEGGDHADTALPLVSPFATPEEVAEHMQMLTDSFRNSRSNEGLARDAAQPVPGALTTEREVAEDRHSQMGVGDRRRSRRRSRCRSRSRTSTISHAPPSTNPTGAVFLTARADLRRASTRRPSVAEAGTKRRRVELVERDDSAQKEWPQDDASCSSRDLVSEDEESSSSRGPIMPYPFIATGLEVSDQGRGKAQPEATMEETPGASSRRSRSPDDDAMRMQARRKLVLEKSRATASMCLAKLQQQSSAIATRLRSEEDKRAAGAAATASWIADLQAAVDKGKDLHSAAKEAVRKLQLNATKTTTWRDWILEELKPIERHCAEVSREFEMQERRLGRIRRFVTH